MMRKTVLSVAALALAAGCWMHHETLAAGIDHMDAIRVVLRDAGGSEVGEAVLSTVDEGVRVKVEASGLTPGYHGLHFHERARCEGPSFESAGAHFNPAREEHGFLNARGPHDGDLPNLLADASGNASAEWVTNRVSLRKGDKSSLLRGEGTSLIIHSGPDDYRTDPAGESGTRIACGVVARR